MARFYLAGPTAGLAERNYLRRIARQLEQDGHAVSGDDAQDALKSLRDADAIVVVLDGSSVDGGAAAAAAHAHAIGKPVLGLHGGVPLPPVVAACLSRRASVANDADVEEALGLFYDEVRPFAGRLVRDQIPRLVREAGHEVHFRELPAADKPGFLKRKVAEEAAELERASPGAEKEEIADVLEALEALIRVRGYDRDSLRQVKQAKLKRRGGFERCFVVEATGPAAAPDAKGPDAADRPAAALGEPARPPQEAKSEIDWTADGEPEGDPTLDTIDVSLERRRPGFGEV